MDMRELWFGVTRVVKGGEWGCCTLHNWDMPDVGSANPPDGNMGMGRRGNWLLSADFPETSNLSDLNNFE